MWHEHEPAGQQPITPANPLAPGPRALAVEHADALDGALDVFEARPAGAGGRSFSLWELLRYKGTILTTFCLVALPALVAIWMLVQPQYRARATVEVSPSNPRILYKTEDNGLIPLYQQHLNSQVGIIRGRTVLERVLDQPQVRQTGWYRRPPRRPFGQPDSPLERLERALNVAPRAKTFLIDIDFVARDPQDAVVVVDAIVEQYMNFTRQRSKETDDLVYQRLAEERRSLQATVEGRKSMADKLRRELGTGTPQELVSQKRLRLDQSEAQLQNVRRELELAKWQKAELERLLDAAGTPNADSAENGRGQADPALRYEEDAEWRQAYLAVQAAEHRLRREGAGFGEEHPTMVALRRDVEHAKRVLQTRQAQLDNLWAAGAELPSLGPGGGNTIAAEVAALGRRVKLLQKQEEILLRDLAGFRAEFARDFESARILDQEVQELRYEKGRYDMVRRRLDEKEMERGMLASIKLISPAVASDRPARDQRFMFSGLALVAGLVGGFGLAFGRATLSQTVRQAADLPAGPGAPCLGELPLAKQADDDGPVDCPVQYEHYRMLRTALLHRLGEGAGMAVVVTSAGPRVGKTTVAVMLARSLAQCGKKVLLVDADLRSRGVSRRLDLEESPGLSALLNGRVADAEAILPGQAHGFDVLPAGRPGEQGDPEALVNGVFVACLKRWRQTYDIVLLDAPPVLPVADARILARHADGTIVVVREGSCRRPELLETLASLDGSGGKLLGTVFIGSGRRSSYRRYAYAGYYASV